MVVKYQVERRPIGSNGKIFRGTGKEDRIAVIEPTARKTMTSGTSMGDVAFYDIQDINKPTYSSDYSRVQAQNGEPWLVHSTHFSVDSATESAAPLASAIGAENVRIVQVLSHKTFFKLN